MLHTTATAETPILKYGHLPRGRPLLQDRPAWGDLPGLDRLLLREPAVAAYRPRYLDLRKDFAFKHTVGQEPNKDLLTHFLNSLFKGRKTISDLSFGPTERPGETEDIRKAIYDIQCASNEKEQFIIEMQQEPKESFFRRLLYYSMRLGSGLIPAGQAGDNYPLPKICAIAIVDYDPWKNLERPPVRENDYINTYRLANIDTGHSYPAALELTLVELPRFTKSLFELRTDIDKWIYAIKNLHQMRAQPSCFKGPIFDKLFQITDYQNLSKEEKIMLIDQERERRNDAKRYRLEGEAIGEKRAEKRMTALKDLNFVQALIKAGDYDDRKIASLVGVDESFVRQQRQLRARIN